MTSILSEQQLIDTPAAGWSAEHELRGLHNALAHVALNNHDHAAPVRFTVLGAYQHISTRSVSVSLSDGYDRLAIVAHLQRRHPHDIRRACASSSAQARSLSSVKAG